MQITANHVIVEHPVLHDALATLRDQSTRPDEFRRQAQRATLVLAMEALRDTPTQVKPVMTPLGPAECQVIGPDIVVVPVLRAGLSMLEAVLELVPKARVGHIGLQRDETTAVPSKYYAKLPGNLETSIVLMIDPMLATGGSGACANKLIAEAGARDIRMISLVIAPEGLVFLAQECPKVTIYGPAPDKGLNPHKFIVPGLGDFGDRLYGTT